MSTSSSTKPGGAKAPARKKDLLSPDRRALLMEEQRFLLGSLDDLEAEYAAGDIDTGDYEELRDDYTARAAEVIRALDEQREAVAAAAAPPRSWNRRIATVLAVLLVAGVAGWALAQSAGTRRPGEVASGEIARTIRQRLGDALEASSDGRSVEALEIYDEVLAQNPSNAEALAYRGWLLIQTNEPDLLQRGLAGVEAAVAADPEYPDARVFAASGRLALGDAEAAAEHLATFDELNPPVIMLDIVNREGGLRDRIELATEPS